MSEVTDAAFERFDLARVMAKAGIRVVGLSPAVATQETALAAASAALASLVESGATPPADLSERTSAALAAIRVNYEEQRARIEALAVLPPDLGGPDSALIAITMTNTTLWIDAIKAVEAEEAA